MKPVKSGLLIDDGIVDDRRNSDPIESGDRRKASKDRREALRLKTLGGLELGGLLTILFLVSYGRRAGCFPAPRAFIQQQLVCLYSHCPGVCYVLGQFFHELTRNRIASAGLRLVMLLVRRLAIAARAQ